jgi:hypothetical protein
MQKTIRGTLLRLVMGFGLLAFVSAASVPANATGASPNPNVFPRHSDPLGTSYNDWAALWNQWAFSLPAEAHPLFDTADCSAGQSGPVWFLGGKFCQATNSGCTAGTAVRTCAVPAGKALFFPVVSVACNTEEAKQGFCPPATLNLAEMQTWANSIFELTQGIQGTLDGDPLGTNLKRNFRVQGPALPILIPSFPAGQHNLLQAVGETSIGPGSYLLTDAGVYVMLRPLPPGQHTLNFKETAFGLNVTYTIDVQ